MSAGDITEIQQLLSRANMAVDSGDGPGYAACYTDDGVLDMGEAGVLMGTDEIAAGGGSFAGAMPGLRHWVNNHVIDLHGDTATATVYIMTLFGSAEPTIGGTGIYHDELRKTPDGWRFSRRTPYMDDEPGVPGGPS